MAQPLVSILIACRDREATIREAIDSALMQDYPHLEVIVSDSGSKDRSVELIKSYKDERLRAYFHQDRARIDNYRGLYYEYARGDLCLNIDGDDYLTDPSYISKAVAAYQANPGTVLVFAKEKILIDVQGKLIEETVNDRLPAVMDGTWFFAEFPKGYTFPIVTCLFDAGLAKEVEFFRKDIISLDWEALLKLVLHGKVCFLKENVAVYRRHANNSTKSLNVDWILEGAEFVENPYSYALHNKIFPKKMLDEWRSRLLKRYFLKHMVRALLLKQAETQALLEDKLRERYPELFEKIMRDVRYRLFKLVYRSKTITRLIFKYYVKQEGFYADLLTTTVQPEQHRAYHGLENAKQRQ